MTQRQNEDRAQIHHTMAVYCNSLDSGDVDGVLSAFTDDALCLGAGALGRWRQDHLTPLGRIESMGRSWRWQQAGTSGRRQGMRVILHMVSHPVPAALWTELKELRLIDGETEAPQ
jgi:hypothetical protein